MKVLFAASEAAPFAKVGGLADVVGSLPVELSKNGVEAAIILPKYKVIDFNKYPCNYIGNKYVSMGWRNQYAGLFELDYRGIKVFFVDNEYYFGGDKIYGYMEGEAEKYGFFCRAVLELLPMTGFWPDIIHCNDWQTGLIPVLLKTQYQHYNIKTVLTIHNLKYQGTFGTDVLKELMGFDDSMFTSDKLEFYGGASFLKGGLLYADKITTVSPTYRAETLSSYFGEQMEGVLACRGDNYWGILNGIDYTDYDPATDELIPYKYSAANLRNKLRDKAALQKELGLKEEKAPIIALISRLYDQKGIDLIKAMIHELMFSSNFQLVVLGTGDKCYEYFFNELSSWYRDRVAVRLCYDNALAHRIYAASDLFLMPSRFEPCGLSQLIAMKYGAMPIVRRTGGLNDTVIDVGDGGWGFCFNNYNAHEMADSIKRAVEFYNNTEEFRKAQKRGMMQDFSWEKSAKKYIELYNQL